MSESQQDYHTPDPEQLLAEGPSSVERLPKDFLLDLLGGAKDAGDPSKRDYGERYQFMGVLGEGGQGVVLRARDALLEREVAIKALKAPFDEARELHLEREARVGGVLEHPNILPTYDLCQDETGSPFFVMKKIEGDSLEDMLRVGRECEAERVSQRRLIDIFLQVCHAIEYAHSRGVYHLDLKPGNVVIGPFGEVYVVDWGFAAKADDEPKYVAGTPIYIAPERLRGERPDTRSDIYSLGVMLYRILTDKYPRDVGRMSFREYRKRFTELPVIRPREQDPSLPRDLEAIILKAMAEEPDQRYASVRDFANDLERFLDILPVAAYREGVLGRSWKFICRHRTITVMASLVLVALLTAGGFFWRSHVADQRYRLEAEKRSRLERLKRLRARARVPLEKAIDFVEQLREQVENEPNINKRNASLEPAFRLFAEAIRLNPDEAEAYYQRGKTHYLARNIDKALADFRKAYNTDGSYIMAHYYAGKIQSDIRKNNEEARSEFEQMKKLDPDNEFSELGQAYLDLSAGHYDSALARCRRIEDLNGDLSDVFYIRGLVYQKSPEHRDPHKALEAYNRYLQLRQDNPSAWLNHGDVLYHEPFEDYDGAIHSYRAALAAQPGYPWALNALGWTLYKHKDQPREALKLIEQVLDQDNRNLTGYLNRAAIFEALKRPDEAESDYRRAVTLAPEDPRVHYRLGIFLFRQEKLEEAERALTKAIELAPSSSLAPWLHRRGIVYLALDRHADAIRDFEESIRLRDSSKVYPALMRWVALQLTGIPIDRKDFEAQLVSPKNRDWLAALGSYYLGDIKGNTEADKILEVVKLAEGNPEALCETHFYIGAHAYALGQNDLASEQLRLCVKTGVHLYTEYTMAWILLKKIEAKRIQSADN